MTSKWKVKVGFVALLPVLLSSCNITPVSLAYCPASIHDAYSTKTLKVGRVYDDRFNVGNQTNDPREIGEVSWKQSLSPSIYYDTTPVTNRIQTTLHMSLDQAGYKLTAVHPNRVLFTRINEIHLNLEGKNNLQRILYCGLDVKFAVTDANNKVIWREKVMGEGSVDVPMKDLNSVKQAVAQSYVKQAVNQALDDMVLQLERSKGFNKALR